MKRRSTKNSLPLLEERNKNRLIANVSYIIVGKITWNNTFKVSTRACEHFFFFFFNFQLPTRGNYEARGSRNIKQTIKINNSFLQNVDVSHRRSVCALRWPASRFSSRYCVTQNCDSHSCQAAYLLLPRFVLP